MKLKIESFGTSHTSHIISKFNSSNPVLSSNRKHTNMELSSNNRKCNIDFQPRPTETTDVCDANSSLLTTGELQILNHEIFKAYGGRRAFSGFVVTVKSFEDNAVVVEALFANKQHEPKVLVIDGGGSLRRSMVGSIIAQIARNMGWVGIIVNGCIRDIDEINAIDIGIRALGSVPVRSSKKGGGEKHVTVHVGGALIRDGNWLCADSSGILVSCFELSLLGPTHHPILHMDVSTNNYYYYTHTIADYTSPVEGHRLFHAYCLDDHHFFPKHVPRSFNTIDFAVGDATAVGCVKLLNFPKGTPFKYAKNRVDEIDVNNHYIKYTTIEGCILEDKWDHIVYEIRIEPFNTGSHFKMIGHYHAKEGVKPTQEDVVIGRHELKNIHKVVQEVLLFNPELYA